MNTSSSTLLLLLVVAVFDGIVCLLINHHLLPTVSAQPASPRSVEFEPTFEIIDENVAPFFPNGNTLTSVAYDPHGQMAVYLLGFTDPDAVCRYSLKNQSFSPNYCIPMSDRDGVDIEGNGFTHEGVAFFPGKGQFGGSPKALVCIYNISLFNFSFIKCNYPARDISSVSSFYSAVVDGDTGIAYFGGKIPSSSSRRGVCAMNLSTSLLADESRDSSFISCNFSEEACQTGASCEYHSAIIDEGSGYFGSSESSVCQYSLISATANLTFVKCVEVNLTSTIYFNTAIVDSNHHYGYFAGITQLSSSDFFFNICKFQLGSGLFDIIDCLAHAAPYGAQLPAGLQSTFSQIAYFPIFRSPASILGFNLSSSNFSFHSSSPLSIASGTAFIDPAAQRLYLSTAQPTRVCHVELNDLSEASASSTPVTCTGPQSVRNNLDQARAFRTGVNDHETQTAMFAHTDVVCKYDTRGEGGIELIRCISTITSGFFVSVFDNNTGMAIFAGYNAVCSVNRSFLFSECVQGTLFTPTSATFDSNRSLAIFLGKRICVYSTSPLSQLHCHEEDSLPDSILSSTYDTKRAMLYVSLSKSVCRFQISDSAPFVGMFNASTDCIIIDEPNSRPGLYVAMIDERNDLAYFSFNNALLCQVNISVPMFSMTRCVRPYVSTVVRAGFIDLRNNNAYLLGFTGFSKFRILPGDFRLLSGLRTDGTVPVYSSLFDPQRNMALLGTSLEPARIYRFSLNTFSCSENSGGAVAVVNDQSQLQQGPLWVTELKNCHLSLENVSLFGGITFVRNPMQDAAISLRNVTFSSPSSSSSLLSFSQNVDNTRISLSNVKSKQGSSLVQFSPSSRLSSSDVFFFNNTLTQGSFASFSSSSSLDSTTSFTFESNKIVSSSAASSLSTSIATFKKTPFDLGSSKWNFTCTNRWVNGYVNQFNELTFNNDQVRKCEKQTASVSLTASPTSSRSKSISQSLTDSLSTSTSESLSASNTLSGSLSHSDSETTSRSESESTSASLSKSVFCFNLNQQQCSDVGTGNCRFCSNRNLCVPREQDCNCAPLDESLCPLATGCKYCSNANVCVEDDLDCECYVFGETACKLATSTCRWCPNFDSCLPLQEQCYCSTLGETACTRLTQNKCTYCPQQEICLPTTDFNKDTCSCLNMNSTNCQTSKCSWCDNYQTCGLPGWDCDCTSLSNSSASSCSVNSNSHCKLCQDESVCVDAKKFTCRCENFTQSVCGSASSCRWCENLNSCTLPENKNCTCNWLRFEDSCNHNSNEKCSWCATSSDTGQAMHNSPIPNFNYCINNDGKDQCQCSYLSPSLCSIANDPSQNQNKNLNLSTSCRYCPNADICVHPGNDQCECGNFEQHACAATSLCTWKDPVLTADRATQYCSAASVTCSPVMCEGILTQSSCDSSGCSWNLGTSRCASNSACFNFFVAGFTPQPMLLWVIGLLKDVLVVFLVGAYANTFTRPIMKFVTAVKKKVLKQTHIKQQMMDETVYMCDKHCRDDLPISFPQYVERVCESVFELENDDLLDEKNRRVLFDAVAYTLFDNMIWVDIDLLQKKDDDEEINFNKKFGFGDTKKSELSQHEMKDLTVEQVDVKVSDQHEVKDEIRDQNDRGDDDACTSNTGDELKQRQSVQDFLESLTASLITKIAVKHSSPLEQNDVNTRGQLFARFAAAVTTQCDTYLKTKNVDFLKIKVFLTAQDFDSAVTLTKKVDEALIERASAYVFYDHSRSRKVCAAASANTFPPALSLIYYSVALLFLFVSSMITVSLFKNFKRMVQSCDGFAPLVSNNASDSNVTTTTADPGSNDETVIDGSYLTGAYFLLGFRLLNSSAFSTAILVFVKVVRGIYQRFSGIYTLSLQERIPLMALYSDRFIHVMLFLYALLVLPFALCGPTYGSSFGVYCWVPILIAAAILIGDALVLYVSRRFSSLKNRLMTDEAANDEKQQALSKTFGDLNENFEDFLDSSPSKRNFDVEKNIAIPSASPAAKSEVGKGEKKCETSENLKENLLSYTPREGETKTEEEIDSRDIEEQDGDLDEEVVKRQSSIESTSPVNLWNALLVFIMTEEIPVIVISLALQLSFNYAALLHYGDAFGLSNNYGGVYDRDYDSRSLSCIVSMFENDVSSFVSGLSSFVPFM